MSGSTLVWTDACFGESRRAPCGGRIVPFRLPGGFGYFFEPTGMPGDGVVVRHFEDEFQLAAALAVASLGGEDPRTLGADYSDEKTRGGELGGSP